MDNPIQVAPEQAMPMAVDHYNVNRLKQMLTVAEQFFKAGCFTSDVTNVQQAYVKIQAGAEMGLAPMESMSDLVLLKGNVTFWGKGLVKRFRKFGWRIDYKNESASGVTAVVNRGDEIYEEEAKKADVEKGFAYGKDPKSKLRYHALSRISRQYIPEILGSVNYTAEEIQASNSDFGNGSVVDVITEEDQAEIDSINDAQELTTHYARNTGRGKAYDAAIMERKMQIEKMTAAPNPEKEEAEVKAEVVPAPKEKATDSKLEDEVANTILAALKSAKSTEELKKYFKGFEGAVNGLSEENKKKVMAELEKMEMDLSK